MVKAIVTSMAYCHLRNELTDRYVCWGPNTPLHYWLDYRYEDRLCKQLIIIYGDNIFSPSGWRDATYNIKVLQRNIRRKLEIKKRYRVLLYLSRIDKLNSNVSRLISTY